MDMEAKVGLNAVTFAGMDQADKVDILERLKAALRAQVAEIEQQLVSLRGSQRTDTKSSAGDKHETGRAMVQLEIERALVQLSRVNEQLVSVEQVVVDRARDRVGFGNLVGTSAGTYFVAVGFGRLTTSGDAARTAATEPVYCVSLESPVGQALLGSAVGDAVEFQERTLTVEWML